MAVVVQTPEAKWNPTDELGATGLLSFAGQVQETYIEDLRWPAAYAIYDEMRRRDPTLRSMLNAVCLLARQASWRVTPASDKPADREAADFVESCREDMSITFADWLDDCMSFLPFGWSWFETVYKRRQGQQPDRSDKASSQFDDGKTGWRKWAVRRQSSFHRWEFDEGGGVRGLWQMPAPDYRLRFIPIEKSLHFVAERDGGSPEGLALFEAAYEPWHYIKNLQIIGGIGWQRAFVGLPVFEYLERPSPDDKDRVDDMGQGLVVDAKQYVAVPPQVKFRLESRAIPVLATCWPPSNTTVR